MIVLYLSTFLILLASHTVEASFTLQVSIEQVANIGAIGHIRLLQALYLPASLPSLIQLLGSPRYDWATTFREQRTFPCPLEASHFVSLVISQAHLHEKLLPMVMVTREPTLYRALLPHIEHYKPFQIAYSPKAHGSFVSAPEQTILLAPLLHSPHRLGTMTTARAAVQHLGAPAWELAPYHSNYDLIYKQLIGCRVPISDSRGPEIMSNDEPVRHRRCACDDNEATIREENLLIPLAAAVTAACQPRRLRRDALNFLAHLQSQIPSLGAIRSLAKGWRNRYIYEKIKLSLHQLNLPPSRLALWESKVVLSMLCTANHAMLPVHTKFLNKVFSVFVLKYQALISPAYWLAIAKQAARLKLCLSLVKVSKGRRKHLRGLLMSPNLIKRDLVLVAPDSLYLRCELWRRKIFSLAENICWPEQGFESITSLVNFVDTRLVSFDNASSLLRSLPVGNVINVRFEGKQYRLTTCFLRRVTHEFNAHVLRRVSLVLPVSSEQVSIWKMLCWLVCANLLHRNTVGPLSALSSNALGALFDGEHQLGTKLHALIKETRLTHYIALKQLLRPLAVLQYRLQHPRPGEMAVFLCLCYLTLLSLVSAI